MSWPLSSEALVIIVGILCSVYLWGIIRTAIWILPNLFIDGGLWLTSSAMLSFFTVTSWFAPHQKRAFDLREFSKERWTLTFFVTGIVSGFLTFPPRLLFMALSSLIPLIIVKALIVFKLPPSRVLFLHAQTRTILSVLSLALIAYHLWEIYQP